MSFALIIQVVLAALKFPTELGAFIQLLQTTPAEKHAELIARIQKESDAMKETGRPTWS